MNDKTLLTLAAKAAGIEYDPARSEPHPVSDAWWGLWLVYHREPTQFDRRYWNPLRDDGDALRLAVKLGIEIGFGASGRKVWVGQPYRDVQAQEDAAGTYSIQEATRRAIVRAAAEIGRGM